MKKYVKPKAEKVFFTVEKILAPSVLYGGDEKNIYDQYVSVVGEANANVTAVFFSW